MKTNHTPSRRRFMQGDWPVGSSQATATTVGSAEIVSLIVNAWPAHLAEVEAAIVALGNAEIYGRDEKGKIIVVIEAPTQSEIGFRANIISGLPHVLSSVMVFQATDQDREVG